MGREVLATLQDKLGRAAPGLLPGGLLHEGLLPEGRTPGGPVLARDRLLPVMAALAGLFPEGGLRRGSTVTVRLTDGGTAFPGATSLALALLSGPCTSGSWCAVVGAPDLGLVAAAQLGIDLERLALVPSAGAQWAVATAALLEGFDVVLLKPPGQVGSSDARKLQARARERGSVLAVLADNWPGSADLQLGVVAGGWRGLEEGSGYLAGRQIEVIAGGRGASSRPRRGHLQLGSPISLSLVETNGSGSRRALP